MRTTSAPAKAPKPQSNAPDTTHDRRNKTPVGCAPRTTSAPTKAPKPLKVLYLQNTFPKPSETFIRREVSALNKLDLDLEIHSLWGGEQTFEGRTVHLYPKTKLLTLAWTLPWWLIKKPGAFIKLAKNLWSHKPGSLEDAAATFLGLAFAITRAGEFSKPENRPDLIHAGWAAMPATAAQALSALTGIPFTFQAHAYDIFRNGGDWLLPSKLREAKRIITSTDYARAALIMRGAPADKVMTVRRGLSVLPPLGPSRARRTPLRLLSIGRLVEKKGFRRQLVLLAAMKRAGLRFEARIVGGGPLEDDLRERIRAFGLDTRVKLTGPQSYTACRQHYQWADVFLFTGQVAGDGDRDGLPNVIAEAMASGVPVAATPVAGVPEAIRDGDTGLLIPDGETSAWARALKRLRDDDAVYEALRTRARDWVHEYFDIDVNARMLGAQLRRAAGPERRERRKIRDRRVSTAPGIPIHRRRASDRIDYRRPEHVS